MSCEVKIAISIHEVAGQSVPVVAIATEDSTDQECMTACAMFGRHAWELRDGEQIGNYKIRLEPSPGAPLENSDERDSPD